MSPRLSNHPSPHAAVDNIIRLCRTVIVVVFAVLLPLTAAAGQATTAKPAAQADMPRGLWEAFSEARHAIEPVTGTGGVSWRAQNPASRLSVSALPKRA